jgi:hypothetical protein
VRGVKYYTYQKSYITDSIKLVNNDHQARQPNAYKAFLPVTAKMCRFPIIKLAVIIFIGRFPTPHRL